MNSLSLFANIFSSQMTILNFSYFANFLKDSNMNYLNKQVNFHQKNICFKYHNFHIICPRFINALRLDSNYKIITSIEFLLVVESSLSLLFSSS